MTKVTILTMLRLTGNKKQGDSQELFNRFESFKGKFDSEIKRFAENDDYFEVFYLLPNKKKKKALTQYIMRRYCVSEKPVVALKITTSKNIKKIVNDVEKKANKSGGKVVSSGYDEHEGRIVITFDQEKECRLFKIWAVCKIR